MCVGKGDSLDERLVNLTNKLTHRKFRVGQGYAKFWIATSVDYRLFRGVEGIGILLMVVAGDEDRRDLVLVREVTAQGCATSFPVGDVITRWRTD